MTTGRRRHRRRPARARAPHHRVARGPAGQPRPRRCWSTWVLAAVGRPRRRRRRRRGRAPRRRVRRRCRWRRRATWVPPGSAPGASSSSTPTASLRPTSSPGTSRCSRTTRIAGLRPGPLPATGVEGPARRARRRRGAGRGAVTPRRPALLPPTDRVVRRRPPRAVLVAVVRRRRRRRGTLLGGFDTGYVGYGAEDTDLAFRARSLGMLAGVVRRRDGVPPVAPADPPRPGPHRRARRATPTGSAGGGVGGRWRGGCTSWRPPVGSTSTRRPTGSCSWDRRRERDPGGRGGAGPDEHGVVRYARARRRRRRRPLRPCPGRRSGPGGDRRGRAARRGRRAPRALHRSALRAPLRGGADRGGSARRALRPADRRHVPRRPRRQRRRARRAGAPRPTGSWRRWPTTCSSPARANGITSAPRASTIDVGVVPMSWEPLPPGGIAPRLAAVAGGRGARLHLPGQGPPRRRRGGVTARRPGRGVGHRTGQRRPRRAARSARRHGGIGAGVPLRVTGFVGDNDLAALLRAVDVPVAAQHHDVGVGVIADVDRRRAPSCHESIVVRSARWHGAPRARSTLYDPTDRSALTRALADALADPPSTVLAGRPDALSPARVGSTPRRPLRPAHEADGVIDGRALEPDAIPGGLAVPDNRWDLVRDEVEAARARRDVSVAVVIPYFEQPRSAGDPLRRPRARARRCTRRRGRRGRRRLGLPPAGTPSHAAGLGAPPGRLRPPDGRRPQPRRTVDGGRRARVPGRRHHPRVRLRVDDRRLAGGPPRRRRRRPPTPRRPGLVGRRRRSPLGPVGHR